MIFEAKTLEEAYQKATKHYNKSISELDIKIIQSPSKGLFGFFSKNAIIEIEDQIEEKEVVLSIDKVVEILKKDVNDLFELSCFNIDEIDVRVYNEDTIMFEITGDDSALLIGKEGYRYNALSTLLFNWVFQKYGYKTRLEISSFLSSQEEMMREYLEPTIEEIRKKGRCKTKPFDGILVHIAVEILRKEFPNKYVAIKKHKDGSQYIIVNEFLSKNG